jgi:hypothetical protein
MAKTDYPREPFQKCRTERSLAYREVERELLMARRHRHNLKQLLMAPRFR